MPITSHSLLPAPKHFVHRRRVKNQAQNTASYGRQLGLLKSNSGRTARESSLVALASEDSVEAGPSLRRNPLYVEACRYALRRRYDEGRLAFEKLLSHEPHLCRGWVSYAQMEKRSCRDCNDMVFGRARTILQRAMSINPNSACLAQAWGLLELQRGNEKGATNLLERCVRLDPGLSPVLKWHPVRQARQNTRSNRKSGTRIQGNSFR